MMAWTELSGPMCDLVLYMPNSGYTLQNGVHVCTCVGRGGSTEEMLKFTILHVFN